MTDTVWILIRGKDFDFEDSADRILPSEIPWPVEYYPDFETVASRVKRYYQDFNAALYPDGLFDAWVTLPHGDRTLTMDDGNAVWLTRELKSAGDALSYSDPY